MLSTSASSDDILTSSFATLKTLHDVSESLRSSQSDSRSRQRRQNNNNTGVDDSSGSSSSCCGGASANSTEVRSSGADCPPTNLSHFGPTGGSVSTFYHGDGNSQYDDDHDDVERSSRCHIAGEDDPLDMLSSFSPANDGSSSNASLSSSDDVAHSYTPDRDAVGDKVSSGTTSNASRTSNWRHLHDASKEAAILLERLCRDVKELVVRAVDDVDKPSSVWEERNVADGVIIKDMNSPHRYSHQAISDFWGLPPLCHHAPSPNATHSLSITHADPNPALRLLQDYLFPVLGALLGLFNDTAAQITTTIQEVYDGVCCSVAGDDGLATTTSRNNQSGQSEPAELIERSPSCCSAPRDVSGSSDLSSQSQSIKPTADRQGDITRSAISQVIQVALAADPILGSVLGHPASLTAATDSAVKMQKEDEDVNDETEEADITKKIEHNFNGGVSHKAARSSPDSLSVAISTPRDKKRHVTSQRSAFERYRQGGDDGSGRDRHEDLRPWEIGRSGGGTASASAAITKTPSSVSKSALTTSFLSPSRTRIRNSHSNQSSQGTVDRRPKRLAPLYHVVKHEQEDNSSAGNPQGAREKEEEGEVVLAVGIQATKTDMTTSEEKVECDERKNSTFMDAHPRSAIVQHNTANHKNINSANKNMRGAAAASSSCHHRYPPPPPPPPSRTSQHAACHNTSHSNNQFYPSTAPLGSGSSPFFIVRPASVAETHTGSHVVSTPPCPGPSSLWPSTPNESQSTSTCSFSTSSTRRNRQRTLPPPRHHPATHKAGGHTCWTPGGAGGEQDQSATIHQTSVSMPYVRPSAAAESLVVDPSVSVGAEVKVEGTAGGGVRSNCSSDTPSSPCAPIVSGSTRGCNVSDSTRGLRPDPTTVSSSSRSRMSVCKISPVSLLSGVGGVPDTDGGRGGNNKMSHESEDSDEIEAFFFRSRIRQVPALKAMALRHAKRLSRKKRKN